MSNSKKHILVTGSNGFMGKHVCNYLIKKGFNIVGFDKSLNSSQDITIVQDVNKYVNKNTIGIIHLAAISRVKTGEELPWNCIRINIMGTTNILESAKRLIKKPWVILSSTIEEPTNIYGLSKYCCNKIAQYYSGKYGLNVFVLELPTVHGIGDNQEKFIPKVMKLASENQNIEIQNPDNMLEFIEISDLLTEIYIIIKELLKDSNYGYEKKYIKGAKTTYLAMAKTIVNIKESKSKIIIMR